MQLINITLEEATSNKNLEDIKAGFDFPGLYEYIGQKRKDPFTSNLKHAMGITPTGKLIDGIGVQGLRTLDHSNALIDGATYHGIKQALKFGAVRVIHEGKKIETHDGTLNGLNADVKNLAEILINYYEYDLGKNNEGFE